MQALSICLLIAIIMRRIFWKKNNLIKIIYFLSLFSCNSTNSVFEDNNFEFNKSKKIIEGNLKPKENHLKSEEAENDLIIKIIEIVKC